MRYRRPAWHPSQTSKGVTNMADKDKDAGAIEASPVLLDDGTDLGILSDAEKWTAEVARKATDIAGQYSPHEIVDDEDYKKSKADRAAARKAIKAIDDERKSKTELIEKVLKDFRSGVKDAMAPLSGIDAGYKDYLDAYDAKRSEARLDLARSTYESEFPDLAEEIPFDVLERAYGKRDKWSNVTTSDKKLLDSVRSRAGRCVAELDTISKLPYSAAIVARAKADYLSSLDLNAVTAQARTDWENEQEVARERATGKADDGQPAEPAAVPGLSPDASRQGPAEPAFAPSAYQAPSIQQQPNPFEATAQAPDPAEPEYVDAPMGIPAAIPNYDAPERHRYRIETSAITDEQLAAVDAAFKAAGVGATLVVID